MLLSTYGIEFVEGRRTGKYIPTCHRFVDKDVLTNENYLSAMANASDEQKESYTAAAQRISVLQKGIKAKLDSEEPYDVFISFKSTDSEARATEDSVIARNLYDALTKRGIKTFFSEVTLRDRIGDEYEPIIYRALYSCKFFILVATSEEYVNAPWVKNEWSRFEDRIVEEGLSGACTAVFRGINPYNLPRAFQNQGIDVEKHPFDYTILLAGSLENKLRGAANSAAQNNSSEADELRKRLAEMENMMRGFMNAAATASAAPTDDKKQDEAHDFDKICTVKDGVIVKCNDKTIRSLTIPNTVIGIATMAFSECEKLTDITIPNSLRAINDFAFSGCTSLATVIIPDSVTTVGAYAFSNCEGLESLTLSNSLAEIGECGFAGCGKLKSINIPASVLSIGKKAFSKCESVYKKEKLCKE